MSSHISNPDENTATQADANDLHVESSLGMNLKNQELGEVGEKVSFHPAREACESANK